MLESRLRWFPLLLPGIAALAIGCGGYNSEYVPPPDGRPRLTWQDNRVVAIQSNPVPAACNADADALANGYSEAPKLRGSVSVVGGGGVYWVPVHHVHVVHVGGPAIVPVPRPILPITGGGGGGSIGKIGGGGGGGDLGKAAIVVAVLALAVLPFVALGLATGRPEPEKDVAIAIDRVNAQTDLARLPGSPCDELLIAGEVSQ
ncbi:MAG: hypothetical protein R3B70_10500 [Polyangiaceae bacterium]